MMHIEFLVEDSSGKKFLELIIPKILDETVSWRVHGYKGIGRIPSNLKGKADPAKRIILDQLPRLLAGYGKTPHVDAVVVVVDADVRNCVDFLTELKVMAGSIKTPRHVLFRLAIEEMEAWYFGDSAATLAAYPNTNRAILKSYVQDSVCGTWETLADATYPGGAERINAQGWPAAGVLKHEWAEKITPHMDPEANASPSFRKFRDGVRALT